MSTNGKTLKFRAAKLKGFTVDGARMQLSPKLWTLEAKLSLGPDVNKF